MNNAIVGPVCTVPTVHLRVLYNKDNIEITSKILIAELYPLSLNLRKTFSPRNMANNRHGMAAKLTLITKDENNPVENDIIRRRELVKRRSSNKPALTDAGSLMVSLR